MMNAILNAKLEQMFVRCETAVHTDIVNLKKKKKTISNPCSGCSRNTTARDDILMNLISPQQFPVRKYVLHKATHVSSVKISRFLRFELD